jgi:catechol 2,3-dioxygenase-like lactoylglutathione lyase family enzyme
MEVPAFRVHGVRYQTRDVNRAVAFYTHHLSFRVEAPAGIRLRECLVRRY